MLIHFLPQFTQRVISITIFCCPIQTCIFPLKPNLVGIFILCSYTKFMLQVQIVFIDIYCTSTYVTRKPNVPKGVFFCGLSEIKFNIEPYVKIKSQLQNPLFQCERKHFISNLNIFPLTSLSDIVSINKLTLIQKNFSQCDVRTRYDVTDKTNNISFDDLNIHFHQYHSSTHWTCCDTSDNVCLTLQTAIILYMFV